MRCTCRFSRLLALTVYTLLATLCTWATWCGSESSLIARSEQCALTILVKWLALAQAASLPLPILRLSFPRAEALIVRRCSSSRVLLLAARLDSYCVQRGSLSLSLSLSFSLSFFLPLSLSSDLLTRSYSCPSDAEMLDNESLNEFLRIFWERERVEARGSIDLHSARRASASLFLIPFSFIATQSLQMLQLFSRCTVSSRAPNCLHTRTCPLPFSQDARRTSTLSTVSANFRRASRAWGAFSAALLPRWYSLFTPSATLSTLCINALVLVLLVNILHNRK